MESYEELMEEMDALALAARGYQADAAHYERFTGEEGNPYVEKARSRERACLEKWEQKFAYLRALQLEREKDS